jgi:hypothetical protein
MTIQKAQRDTLRYYHTKDFGHVEEYLQLYARCRNVYTCIIQWASNS